MNMYIYGRTDTYEILKNNANTNTRPWTTSKPKEPAFLTKVIWRLQAAWCVLQGKGFVSRWE